MKIWLITVSKSPRYQGNPGYPDIAESYYCYDSLVQNHKSVSRGDIVIVREEDKVIGAARITALTEKDGQKWLTRCPRCDSRRLHKRKTMTPKWRCERGHEFDTPDLSTRDVTNYEAEYASTFTPLAGDLTRVDLEPFLTTRNQQLSIRRFDLDRFLEAKSQRFNELRHAIKGHLFAPKQAPSNLDSAIKTPAQRSQASDAISKGVPGVDSFGLRGVPGVDSFGLREGLVALSQLREFLEGARAADDKDPRHQNMLRLPLTQETFDQLYAEVRASEILLRAPMTDVNRLVPLKKLLTECREIFAKNFAEAAGKSTGMLAGPAVVAGIASALGLLDAVLAFISSLL